MSNSKTYRDELEDDFRSYLDRLDSIKFSEEPDASLEQFKKVLAVQFALNSANDIVRKYRYDMHYIDESSPEYPAFAAAESRMNTAFREILSGGETQEFDKFKELVFRALDRLVEPSPEEVLIAEKSGGTTMADLTDDFLTIRDFLRTQVKRQY